MSLRNAKFNIRKILLIGVLSKFIVIAVAVITPSIKNDTIDIKQFSARGLGHTFVNCLSAHEMSNCFKNQLLNLLETAVKDNSTWHYNDFLIFEKKLSKTNESKIMNFLRNRQERSFSDTIAEKLWDLLQTRALRLALPEEASRVLGISDAVDDILSPVSSKPNILTSFAEEGTVRVFNGFIEDKIEALSNSGHKKKKEYKNKKKNKKKISFLYNKNPLKGRKKKDKDKNMAVIGGMAMMAMIAQMFLGKVLLIAGAAFIMSKIALAVSLLGSLKKGSTGSSGSTTEHVIISGGGGGGGHSHAHSHESGWHRSIMPYEAHKPEHPNLSIPPKNGEGYHSAALLPSLINSGEFHSSYDVQEMSGFL